MKKEEVLFEFIKESENFLIKNNLYLDLKLIIKDKIENIFSKYIKEKINKIDIKEIKKILEE